MIRIDQLSQAQLLLIFRSLMAFHFLLSGEASKECLNLAEIFQSYLGPEKPRRLDL